MNILRHTLNIIGGLIMLFAGTALAVFLSTGDPGPQPVPVAFILCLILVPAIAHVFAAVSVWRLSRSGLQTLSALASLVAATVATFVWLSFVLTLLELIVRNATGVPVWQIAVSFLVACVVPLASALNSLLLWRVLSVRLRPLQTAEACSLGATK